TRGLSRGRRRLPSVPALPRSEIPDCSRGVLHGGTVGREIRTGTWPGCRAPRGGRRLRGGKSGHGAHALVPGARGTGYPAAGAVLPGHRCGLRHGVLPPVRRGLPPATRHDDVVLG